MNIKDLKLSKGLLETINDFKYEIISKVKETGTKFVHCSGEDFNKVFRPIFMEYGFKIFKQYWAEFDYKKSEYPNKELYIKIVDLNHSAALHYFHNSIFLKITDIIINAIITGDEDYLYSAGEMKAYDSKSIYFRRYCSIYYDLTTDEKDRIFKPGDEATKLLEKLSDISSHGSFLLSEISQAAYYKVDNDKFIKKINEIDDLWVEHILNQ